jgi:hypothetical protein
MSLEHAAELLPGALADYHGARPRKGLQASRQVRCLADHAALLRRPGANQIADHDKPGGDTDASLQWLWCWQSADRIDGGKSGAHCPFSIVLMSLRVTPSFNGRNQIQIRPAKSPQTTH